MSPMSAVSRRRLLGGTATIVGVCAVAACGGGEGTPTTATTTPAPGDEQPKGGVELARLADIPEGGGTVVTADSGPVVLVREGQAVRAFDGRCPHQGATLAAPVNGEITCPLHRSRFSARDGALRNGPATKGLEPIAVTVVNDTVVTA